jgi:hypothetical protein
MNNTDTMLVEYVRDRKRNPIGAVIGVRNHKDVSVGWSLTNRKAGDRFDKDMAIKIALGRAVEGTNKALPHTVAPIFNKMVERAKRYFQV